MSKWIAVEPAYGVKLNSVKAVKEHFDSGKDFRILDAFTSGSYINKRDVEGLGNVKLEVRYGKNGEKVMVL